MKYLGIDLAWSSNNYTALALLEENCLKELVYLKSNEAILSYINEVKPDKIGIDAPLEVGNQTGNREIEKAFIKDFARFKLAAYPVNRNLFLRLYKEIRGEYLVQQLCSYKLRETLFEVYPHATILQLFTKTEVLPYKRKKGRDTAFIKRQLKRYEAYLNQHLQELPAFNIDQAKGKALKQIEDELDAITSALTLFHCDHHTHTSYDNLLIIP